MAIAFTFPGQGSQAVGMGKALGETFQGAKDVFREVDDALSQKLSVLMWEGPSEELTLTENAQPALMAVSMAVMRVLSDEKGFSLADHAKFIAGHSLGEYSALAAAGTFSLGDAARLLKTRGQAMQRAVPVGEGAMAALLGLDFDDVCAVAEAAAKSGGVCQTANDNAPGQVVISGSKEAVGRAVELAKEKGAKRAMLLPVSAPFHCSLMQPAAEIMEEALGAVEMAAPSVPLVANVSASVLTSPEEIRKSLVAQVTGMVRWRECVGFLAHHGVGTVYEAGAGKVLSGLARRIDRELEAKPLGTAEEIDAFAP